MVGMMRTWPGIPVKGPQAMLRTHSTSSQLDLFDPFLPEEMKGLPADSGAVDEFLDDERFFAPYRAHFDPVWGRPSVPIETYLQKLIRFRTLWERWDA